MKKKERMNDRAFLVDIIFQIKEYAEKNDMDVDETIKRTAENMLALLKIATFKGDGDTQ